MTPPSKSSKLQIVGRVTSVTYPRLEPGTAYPLLICTKFEVGRFLARLEARPPWPLLPVIDGSNLGSLGITGKRF